MNTLPTVLLRPGEADRIVAGHPWIYAGGILRITAPAANGDLVQIKDHRQRFLGIGFYNAKSKIAVRWLAYEREDINAAFFEGRLRAALAIRKKYLPGANSFRLVNAESDFLSGLIIDKYEDVIVIQISSLGMEQRKHHILSALKTIFSPRAIVERSDAAFRKFEGMEEVNGVIEGTLDGKMSIKLNTLKFEADLLAGHKTGFYLDQQANYRQVGELATGQVLDCFTFVGGFGLHAAKNPAVQRVHMLDQSEDAITAAKRHAELNGVADKCTFETVNVFDWLKQHTTKATNEKLLHKFDTIVLDPPSFTRTRAAVGDALRGYKEIHIRALRLLKTGGTLATFCCSHHVSSEIFLAVIREAAFDTRKTLRRVAIYGQSPDHPVIPSIPETEYLKGFAFELVR